MIAHYRIVRIGDSGGTLLVGSDGATQPHGTSVYRFFATAALGGLAAWGFNKPSAAVRALIRTLQDDIEQLRAIADQLEERGE